MARNFNSSGHANTRVISSWLHEIPSDVGGGSQATLFAPSVYEQSSPRRQKDAPWPAASPPRTPRRPAGVNSTPVKASDPEQTFEAPTSPTKSPARVAPNRNRNSNPIQSPPATPKPSTPAGVAALRAEITANFRAHCLTCSSRINNNNLNLHTGPQPQQIGNPPSPPPPPPSPSPAPAAAAAPSRPPCPRCAAAASYTHRAHHHARFLDRHLRPISAVLSFDETVAYLNEAIVARLSKGLPSSTTAAAGAAFGGGDGGKWHGDVRTYPTLDDFDVVREVAERRRMVFEAFEGLAGGGLKLDRFGMVRDRDLG